VKLDRFRKPRTGASFAISIALHVVWVGALFSIVFRYPLGQLIGIPEPLPKTERLTFVKLAPQATEHSGRAGVPEQGSRPAALVTPAVVPDELPVAVPDSATARAAGGDGAGKGVVGAGIATGVVPMMPDPRIELSPGELQRPKETLIQTADGIIELVVGIALDSMNIAAASNKPVEWIKKGKNGSEWGLTKDYIALGKFKIPTALLAMTPMNRPGPTSPIELRREAWIRRDVLENAQRSISEDEFRAAVKRIRARLERERKEKAEAQAAADKPIPLTP
jgi:hypothetical protein